MTTQEQQLIDGLVQRVNGTALSNKDPEAEGRLQQGLGSNPNALYILAQTVLVQQYALDQAKQQIAGARAEMDRLQRQTTSTPPQKHTGFLDSIFGSHDAPSAPPPPAPSAAGYAPVQTYAPPPPPQQQTYPSSSFGGAPMVGGGGGFLRGAAQTAAGVAAGALAFQGVESLLHGFGHDGGFGGSQGLGSFGGEQNRPEEITNNYYGDQDRTGDADRSQTGSNPGDNLFTDGNSNQSDDASTDASDDGQSMFDSGSDPDNSSSDGGFADDGGSDGGGSDMGNDSSGF